ncbi:MAG: GAF domain-containing protein [Anaerolineae bacterium]
MARKRMTDKRNGEFRQGNETLQAERNLTSAVLDTMAALVMVLDHQGRIVRFNRACERITGYAAEQVRGERVWDLFLTPEETEEVKAVFDELTAGVFPLQYENYLVTRDGERRLMAWSNTALVDDKGAVEYVVATGIDITEQRRAEEALYRARDELEERVRQRTAQLSHRVAFEDLVTTISTRFIDLSSEEIDTGINRALGDVGQFMNVDRSYVFLFSPDGETIDNTHEWCAEGIPCQMEHMQNVPVNDLSWSNDILLRGEILHIPRVAELPPEAEAERQEFSSQGIQSLLAVPMIHQGEVMGFVGFDAVRGKKRWPSESFRLLKTLAAIFVSALERKRAREALQSAYQTLERRVEERTRELATLLEISHNVASTLELDPLLGLILDQLWAVVDYDAASIMILEDDTLSIAAYRGPIPYEEALNFRFSTDEAAANREVIRRREPLIIGDIRSETPLAAAFRETAGDELDGAYGYIRCWMGVPLIVKDRVVGMLTLDHSQPDHYTPQDAKLVMAFADQVAVAIENAQLYEREQKRLVESERRRQVAEGLREILGVLNSNQPLDEVLDSIVAQATRLLDADGDAIYRLNREEDSVAIVTAHGMPAEFMRVKSFPLASVAVHCTVMQQRPFVVPDFSRFPVGGDDLSPPMRQLSRAVREHFGSSLTVPLVVEGEIYGAISLYYHMPHTFSEEEIELAESFADQVALAIGNARLRDQMEKAAVSAERSRLARDLHDAVTQTLFSASLIAEVLPRIWERDPEMGQRRLEELRELTRGALAEMRTLLLELRPSSLEDAALRDLLRQLAESITGRARVPVAVEIEGECALPSLVKVALYRIAQEALNNVAKHANASQAEIYLRCGREAVELCVCDDGKGFDPDDVLPDSLGLGIMRERAQEIEARLIIESERGRGTIVRVVWSCDGARATGGT